MRYSDIVSVSRVGHVIFVLFFICGCNAKPKSKCEVIGGQISFYEDDLTALKALAPGVNSRNGTARLLFDILRVEESEGILEKGRSMKDRMQTYESFLKRRDPDEAISILKNVKTLYKGECFQVDAD